MITIQIGKIFDVKYDFRETCFGIVEIDNKFLLVKKNNQFSLIGGGIEDGEEKVECLKREFLEESGYTITNIQELVCIDCYWLAANKYPMLSKANIYIVRVDENSHAKPLEEGCSSQLIDCSEAIDLLPLPYHKEAIKYYLNCRTKNIWGKKCDCGNNAYDFFDEHHYKENIEKEIICDKCKKRIKVNVNEALDNYKGLVYDCFKNVKGKVLEIGCGGGFLTSYLSNKNDVIHIDCIDNEMNDEEIKYIESIANNFYKLNLNDINEQYFGIHYDYVVCKDVLMYLDNIEYTFEKLSKISDNVILLNWYNKEHRNCINKTKPQDISQIISKYYKNVVIEHPIFHKCGYLIRSKGNEENENS